MELIREDPQTQLEHFVRTQGQRKQGMLKSSLRDQWTWKKILMPTKYISSVYAPANYQAVDHMIDAQVN